jgi:hypothetical protein
MQKPMKYPDGGTKFLIFVKRQTSGLINSPSGREPDRAFLF